MFSFNAYCNACQTVSDLRKHSFILFRPSKWKILIQTCQHVTWDKSWYAVFTQSKPWEKNTNYDFVFTIIGRRTFFCKRPNSRVIPRCHVWGQTKQKGMNFDQRIYSGCSSFFSLCDRWKKPSIEVVLQHHFGGLIPVKLSPLTSKLIYLNLSKMVQ